MIKHESYCFSGVFSKFLLIHLKYKERKREGESSHPLAHAPEFCSSQSRAGDPVGSQHPTGLLHERQEWDSLSPLFIWQVASGLHVNWSGFCVLFVCYSQNPTWCLASEKLLILLFDLFFCPLTRELDFAWMPEDPKKNQARCFMNSAIVL